MRHLTRGGGGCSPLPSECSRKPGFVERPHLPRSARSCRVADLRAGDVGTTLGCVTPDQEPLPFYALVKTTGPGTWEDPHKPLALGAVLGRAQDESGLWNYAILIGEQTYGFTHDELVPIGVVLDRSVLYDD